MPVIRREIMLVLLAAFLSFIIKDAINAFAVAFLPIGEVKIQSAEQENGDGQSVEIVYEKKPNELFLQIKENTENNEDWIYIPGIEGVSWTTLMAQSCGSGLSINIRKNPDYFFSLLVSRWNNSVMELIVDDSRTERIECRAKNNDWEILRIYPYKDNHSILILKVLFHIFAFITFYILIKEVIFSLQNNTGTKEHE